MHNNFKTFGQGILNLKHENQKFDIFQNKKSVKVQNQLGLPFMVPDLLFKMYWFFFNRNWFQWPMFIDCLQGLLRLSHITCFNTHNHNIFDLHYDYVYLNKNDTIFSQLKSRYIHATVKCRTAIKVLFLYFKLYLSVTLDSLSCSFTSTSFFMK